jgi:adenosylcobinamide-phosphate synthase
VKVVDTAVAQGLPAGRARLARLCSRDVSAMDETAVRETAIETLAENLNDSLVAPLFWFVVAGLPGAWAFRAANTLDAMWGYRGRWEWAGKCAARADGLLCWLPARLTAVLLWRPAV